jgi:hypothetical protein
MATLCLSDNESRIHDVAEAYGDYNSDESRSFVFTAPAGAFASKMFETVNASSLAAWNWENRVVTPWTWTLELRDAYASPFLRIQGAAGRHAFVVDLSKGDYNRSGSMSNDSETCDHECDNAELIFEDGTTSFPQLHAEGGAITFDLPSVVLDVTCFLDLSFGRSDSDDNATYSIADAATGSILASVYFPAWEDDMSPTSNVVLPLAGLTTPAVTFRWKSGDPTGYDALWFSPFMTVRMAVGATQSTTTATVTSTGTSTTGTSTVTSITATTSTGTTTTTTTTTSTDNRLVASTAVRLDVFWIFACGLAAEGLRNF